MDPKVKNLIKFIFKNGVLPLAALFLVIKVFKVTDYLRFLGQITIALLLYRIGSSVYKRLILPAKKPKEFGKWAIVTGSTSGIGAEFADYLAKQGMALLIISRSKDKLVEQSEVLKVKYNVPVHHIAYDFTKPGEERTRFYADLDVELKKMDADGGVGLLINNVGIANDIPRDITEFTDEEVDNMIQCNIFSCVHMTRAVFKYMKERRNGGIVSISSGSCALPGPYLAIYSATKAFMTQFSRSLKIEWWDSGVDFYVVTPFYVVSNLYKRKTGTIIAPMPIKLVEGTLAQLGKKQLWEGHGYWFHGFLGNVALYYWDTVARNLNMMKDNRRRYDERQAAKAAAKKSE